MLIGATACGIGLFATRRKQAGCGCCRVHPKQRYKGPEAATHALAPPKQTSRLSLSSLRPVRAPFTPTPCLPQVWCAARKRGRPAARRGAGADDAWAGGGKVHAQQQDGARQVGLGVAVFLGLPRLGLTGGCAGWGRCLVELRHCLR